MQVESIYCEMHNAVKPLHQSLVNKNPSTVPHKLLKILHRQQASPIFSEMPRSLASAHDPACQVSPVVDHVGKLDVLRKGRPVYSPEGDPLHLKFDLSHSLHGCS